MLFDSNVRYNKITQPRSLAAEKSFYYAHNVSDNMKRVTTILLGMLIATGVEPEVTST